MVTLCLRSLYVCVWSGHHVGSRGPYPKWVWAALWSELLRSLPVDVAAPGHTEGFGTDRSLLSRGHRLLLCTQYRKDRPKWFEQQVGSRAQTYRTVISGQYTPHFGIKERIIKSFFFVSDLFSASFIRPMLPTVRANWPSLYLVPSSSRSCSAEVSQWRPAPWTLAWWTPLCTSTSGRHCAWCTARWLPGFWG